MIWLYLAVLGLSVGGLILVILEFRRGQREGLLGPFSTFVVIFSVAGLALYWLRVLDDKKTEVVGSRVEIKIDSPSPVHRVALDSDEVVAQLPGRLIWRAWLTTGQVGIALTALSLLGQLSTIMSARRRDRRHQETERNWVQSLDGMRRSIEDLRYWQTRDLRP